MLQWLSTNWPVIFAVVVALAGGHVGLTRKQARQLKECRQRCEKQAARIRMYARDYTQVLEFNFQDRYTIRELGMMVQDYRKQLNLPETDILLTLYAKAEKEMKARRLASQHDSITRTYPPDSLVDDLDMTEGL
jgi:hypothetical protein